jgi:hypothetical protein
VCDHGRKGSPQARRRENGGVQVGSEADATVTSAVRLAPEGLALTHIEYEIEPAVEVVASVRYPHQQFGLK